MTANHELSAEQYEMRGSWTPEVRRRVMTHCNALNPTMTRCCELDLGHPGKHREELFTGGYAMWEGNSR